MPNPPVPNEIKRQRGTLRKDRIKSAEVIVLPRATEAPKPPKGLGPRGKELWKTAWSQAISWLSPDSDLLAVTEACLLADDVAKARERYRTTGNPADMRALAMASKEFTSALSVLGFNPTARSRLGLAEVKKIDALENVLHRRQAAQKKTN